MDKITRRELSIVKSEESFRLSARIPVTDNHYVTRKKGLTLLGFLIALSIVISIAAATAVALQSSQQEDTAEGSSKATKTPSKAMNSAPQAVTIRVQNANSNLLWMEAVAKLFNDTYINYNGTGIAVSVLETTSRFRQDYKPHVYSPTSFSWVETLVEEKDGGYMSDKRKMCTDVMSLPTGLGMWRKKAEALGWPDKLLEWNELLQLVQFGGPSSRTMDEPSRGFRIGHGNPNKSTTGLQFAIRAATAAAGKGPEQPIELEDIGMSKTKLNMRDIQNSVFYVALEDRSMLDMIVLPERGPSFLDGIVTFEPTIVEYMKNETYKAELLRHHNDTLVFMFMNGTFWNRHPYCILDEASEWTTPEQLEVAREFVEFLQSDTVKDEMKRTGFRPLDFDPHGVKGPAAVNTELGAAPRFMMNNTQPMPQVYPANVTNAVKNLWEETKKPLVCCLALDRSLGIGSDSEFGKLKEAAISFVQNLRNDTQLQLLVFAAKAHPVISGSLSLVRNDAVQYIQSLHPRIRFKEEGTTDSADDPGGRAARKPVAEREAGPGVHRLAKGSALYASTFTCLSWLQQQFIIKNGTMDDARNRQLWNFVSVVFTNGNGHDYLNFKLPIDSAVRSLKAQDINIDVYGVLYSTGDEDSDGFARSFFEDLTAKSGGQTWVNQDSEALYDVFQQISSYT